MICQGTAAAFFCVESLLAEPLAEWEHFFVPVTKCFVSLIFLAVCMGLNANTYVFTN